MALESATTLSGLITANPTSIDAVSQGDDHFRLIKSVLKLQFPGVGGDGYAVPITATEAQLNLLTGATFLSFPAGTKMPFYQASPPTGWTATAIQNDSMMRVVTAATTGGASNAGGGQSPILNNTVPSHTHIFTGDVLAAHTHTDSGHSHSLSFSLTSTNTGGGSSASHNAVPSTTGTASAVISSASAGTPTGTNATNAGSANWAPRYMDFCIGTKS